MQLTINANLPTPDSAADVIVDHYHQALVEEGLTHEEEVDAMRQLAEYANGRADEMDAAHEVDDAELGGEG